MLTTTDGTGARQALRTPLVKAGGKGGPARRRGRADCAVEGKARRCAQGTRRALGSAPPHSKAAGSRRGGCGGPSYNAHRRGASSTLRGGGALPTALWIVPRAHCDAASGLCTYDAHAPCLVGDETRVARPPPRKSRAAVLPPVEELEPAVDAGFTAPRLAGDGGNPRHRLGAIRRAGMRADRATFKPLPTYWNVGADCALAVAPRPCVG
eukprot:scaffold23106_cov30-Tisochrysis_lutea.AAC.2